MVFLIKGAKKMKSRCDFNFVDAANGIKKACGFAICEVTPTTDGADLKVIKIILKKLIARNPNYDNLELIILNHCNFIK
jgi:hypothetical protein